MMAVRDAELLRHLASAGIHGEWGKGRGGNAGTHGRAGPRRPWARRNDIGRTALQAGAGQVRVRRQLAAM